TFCGCGSGTGSPSAPTPAPAPVVPVSQRLLFTVVESDVFASGLAQYGYVDYSICRTIQNLHMGTLEVTGVQATILGPADEVLVSESLPPNERSMGYLAGYFGCRGTVRDSNRARDRRALPSPLLGEIRRRHGGRRGRRSGDQDALTRRTEGI